MQEGEKIKTIVSISLDGDYDKDVMIFTKKGKVKKTSLREFANSKRSGVRAVSLNEDDAVVDSIIVEKEEGKILTVTKHGMAICFNISDVRLMGRTAIGVNAMKIRKDDEIVNAVLIEDSKKLLIMTQNGYAKRESFDEYRIQIRGGIGVKTLKNIKKIGPIVSAIAVSDDNHLLAFTTNGKAIRFSVDSIPVLSRVTQGVIALRLDENDTTMGLAIVKEEEELLKEE
jgi:DNA gyrase subunit A